MRILFLHGWTSTPGGKKPTFLNDHGHEVINPALPDDDFEEAVRIALCRSADLTQGCFAKWIHYLEEKNWAFFNYR